LAYFYVLCGNLFFAASSIIYAQFAKKQGIFWMNFTKALVALVSCFVFLSILGWWTQAPSLLIWPFLVSGFVGLAFGDIFLIGAFARIGSARTMILWGFQPIFVSVGSYFFLNEKFDFTQIIAMFLLISCLISFSFEGFKRRGHWEIAGLGFALFAVFLDAIGLFFSRYGFESNSHLMPLEGHFYRCVGAMAGFLILQKFNPIRFYSTFKSLQLTDKYLVLLASFFGTFLSIFFSLMAVQIGHLPTIAALSITTPLFTATFEHIYERRWPSKIFLFAFFQFIVGFFLLVRYE